MCGTVISISRALKIKVGIKYADREKEEGQSEQMERSWGYCGCGSPDVMEKLLKL